MKISDLTSHPKNPRKITDKQLQMLEKSLKEFGDLSGVIFNQRTKHLIGGHQRLKVLPANAEIKDGYIEANNERYTFRIVDWDEDKESAAMLAANKFSGDWNDQLLADILIDLDTKNFDMDLTGFSKLDMESICAPFSNPIFEPGSLEDQGKLDEKKPVECPNCGHKFTT